MLLITSHSVHNVNLSYTVSLSLSCLCIITYTPHNITHSNLYAFCLVFSVHTHSHNYLAGSVCSLSLPAYNCYLNLNLKVYCQDE